MIYYSELHNRKVYTEEGTYIGTLKDLIFQALEKSIITKVIIRTSRKEDLIIPVRYIKKIEKRITMNAEYSSVEISENEMYVVKNLLDKQIIDIKGNKIVRVNDVAIQERPSLSIAGVDIGYLGILRWLKLENLFVGLLKTFHVDAVPRFLSWSNIQPLELARGKVVLNREEEKLEKIPPEDLADHLEKTTILNIRRVIDILDDEYAAEVVGNLNINYQTALFKHFDPDDAADLITLIDPDEAADILLTLTPKERDKIMSLLPDDIAKEINYLFSISQTPIGELLTTEFITVNSEITVKETIDIVRRQSRDFSFFNYVYVVNKQKELVGVFNLHELLLQSLNNHIYKFMTQNVVVIHLTTPKEIAIKKMMKYKIYALPVIDKSKHVIGMVTYDDIADEILTDFNVT